jgi:hypothetical protein
MDVSTLTNLPFESVSHSPDIKKQVFLRHGGLGPITQFARAVFQPGDVAPGHSHQDMGEIFYVLSGTLTITVDEPPPTRGWRLKSGMGWKSKSLSVSAPVAVRRRRTRTATAAFSPPPQTRRAGAGGRGRVSRKGHKEPKRKRED